MFARIRASLMGKYPALEVNSSSEARGDIEEGFAGRQ